MKDVFAQVAYIDVTESAANTLTFDELNIATEISKKRAMIVHRIEYNVLASSMQLIIAAGDAITMGLSLSDSLSSTSLDQIEVFDRETVTFDAIVTSGNIFPPSKPIDKRFNDMPGGGLLVPVKKLYLFVEGTSLASAAAVRARLWYTIKDLSDADYIELVEAYNILK